MAIQGKLVPQDPADEPASVLLGKIRKERTRLVEEGKIRRPKTESLSTGEGTLGRVGIFLHLDRVDNKIIVTDSYITII